MTWVMAGSYYIREGVQDSDETWGKALQEEILTWQELTCFLDRVTEPRLDQLEVA